MEASKIELVTNRSTSIFVCIFNGTARHNVFTYFLTYLLSKAYLKNLEGEIDAVKITYRTVAKEKNIVIHPFTHTINGDDMSVY